LLELLKLLHGERHRNNLCNHRLLGSVLVHWYNVCQATFEKSVALDFRNTLPS
jgi:hypothetical protein